MTHSDPENPTVTQDCRTCLPTPRAARVSFILGILAYIGSGASIAGVPWPHGLILAIMLACAGVCGTMTAIRAWETRSRMKQPGPDNVHAA